MLTWKDYVGLTIVVLLALLLAQRWAKRSCGCGATRSSTTREVVREVQTPAPAAPKARGVRCARC